MVAEYESWKPVLNKMYGLYKSINKAAKQYSYIHRFPPQHAAGQNSVSHDDSLTTEGSNPVTHVNIARNAIINEHEAILFNPNRLKTRAAATR